MGRPSMAASNPVHIIVWTESPPVPKATRSRANICRRPNPPAAARLRGLVLRLRPHLDTANLDGGGGGGWQDDGLEAHLHHLLRGPQAPRRTPPGRPHLRPRLPRALVITRLTF